MAGDEPKFESYQDVRTTLTWWSIPFWLAMMFAIYFGVMPPEHRADMRSIFPGLADWITGAGSLVAAGIVAKFLSQFMIHVLEIHDRIYDRHIVKWRWDYDTRVILPALLKPLEEDLPLAALAIATAHRDKSMEQLYYAFVGDRDTKIRKNLVVRFYEVITKYWLAQLLEIAALLVVLVDVPYALVELLMGKPFRPALYWTLVAALGAWLLARVAALRIRPLVARRTNDQIEAIHKDFTAEFRKAVADFFAAHGIRVPTA
jgi:hypothetical protein